MPKACSIERTLKLLDLLGRDRGVTVPELMKEFDIAKPSAMRMIDVMSCNRPVEIIAARYNPKGGPAANVYRMMRNGKGLDDGTR